MKALPLSRRGMTPPTPMQHSNTSFEREQGSYEGEGRGWNARERTIIARTTQFLERSYSVKVRVEELEGFLVPEDVDFRRILKVARDERERKIFETFSSNDVSFLVAEWSRWDKYTRAPWRQGSSASASGGWRREVQEQLIVSWSPVEKRVMVAVEEYLESCAQVMVDIDVVERLLRPENLEVSLKNVLKHATTRGSNIFQFFDTSEKPNHFVAIRRRWLESQGRNGARQEIGQNEWYDLEYQGATARAPPCPDSTLQTPLPQQSSLSAGEEVDHWVVMEDRQRRRIACENLAKGMLLYLDCSNDVKVGITELQERVEVP